MSAPIDQHIKRVADALQALVEALHALPSPDAPAALAAPADTAERTPRRALTVPALRERCMALAMSGRTEAIVALLAKYGAKRLDDLDPKHYVDFELDLLVLESEPAP